MTCHELPEEWIQLNNRNLEQHPFVALYTRKFDQIINGGLRSSSALSFSKFTFTALARDLVQEILTTLEESPPFPSEICLFRGFKYFPALKEMLVRNEEEGITSRIMLKGFNSLSCDKYVAFEVYGGDDADATVCFLPGDRFLYLRDLSVFGGEEEVLTFPDVIWEFKGYTEKLITLKELDEVDPMEGDRFEDVEDFSYHFQYQGSNFEMPEADSNFDLHFLFFLSELVERADSFYPLKNWPDLYLSALKNQTGFEDLTDLWGFSEEFELELVEKRRTVSTFEEIAESESLILFYQDFLIGLVSRFISLPMSAFTSLRLDHEQFLEFQDLLPSADSGKPFNLLPQTIFPVHSKTLYRGNASKLSREGFLLLSQRYQFSTEQLSELSFDIPEEYYLTLESIPREIRTKVLKTVSLPLLKKLVFRGIVSSGDIPDPEPELRLWKRVFKNYTN